MNQFGDFLTNKRTEKSLTLKKFCEQSGFDASYISKLERGIIEVPIEKEFYTICKKILNLSDQEFKHFIKLSKKHIPIKNSIKQYPVFVPANIKTPEQLQKIIDFLNDEDN